MCGQGSGGGGFLCCIVCLLCFGPLFIIIGVVIMVAPNSRADNIAKYNAAVEKFNGPTGDASVISSWRGTAFVTSPGHEKNVQLDTGTYDNTGSISGSKDDIKEGNSVYKYATFVPDDFSTRSSQIHFEFPPVQSISSSVGYAAPFYINKTFQHTVRCGDEGTCYDDCRSGCGSMLYNYCRSTYGPGARHSGPSSCSRGTSCGTCLVTHYLETACAVVTQGEDRETYVSSSTMASCFYPFTEQKYVRATRNPYYFEVQLRSDTDPYIVLQQLTKGTMNFGLSAEAQRAAGMAVLIFGVVLTLCVIGPILCYFRARNEQEKQDKLNEERIRNQNNLVQMQPQPQPAYGQPGYGQPAQGEPVGFQQPVYQQQQYQQQQQQYPHPGGPPPQQQGYGQPHPDGYAQPPPQGYPPYPPPPQEEHRQQQPSY